MSIGTARVLKKFGKLLPRVRKSISQKANIAVWVALTLGIKQKHLSALQNPRKQRAKDSIKRKKVRRESILLLLVTRAEREPATHLCRPGL